MRNESTENSNTIQRERNNKERYIEEKNEERKDIRELPKDT